MFGSFEKMGRDAYKTSRRRFKVKVRVYETKNTKIRFSIILKNELRNEEFLLFCELITSRWHEKSQNFDNIPYLLILVTIF